MNRYNTLLPLAAAAVIALAPLQAAAAGAGEAYLGLQYANLTYAPDAAEEEWEPTALTLRGGTYLNDAFAFEARYGTGMSEDTQERTVFGNPVQTDIEIDSLLGFYALGHLPLGDGFRVYGAAGWTEVEATATASAGNVSVSDSGSESGFSWGLGGQLDLGERFALSIEYMQYLDEDDLAVESLGLGVEFFF